MSVLSSGEKVGLAYTLSAADGRQRSRRDGSTQLVALRVARPSLRRGYPLSVQVYKPLQQSIRRWRVPGATRMSAGLSSSVSVLPAVKKASC